MSCQDKRRRRRRMIQQMETGSPEGGQQDSAEVEGWCQGAWWTPSLVRLQREFHSAERRHRCEMRRSADGHTHRHDMPSYTRLKRAQARLRLALSRHARARWGEHDDDKDEPTERREPLPKRIRQLLHRRTNLPVAVTVGDEQIRDSLQLAEAMCARLTCVRDDPVQLPASKTRTHG